MTNINQQKKYYMVRAMDSTEQYYNYFINHKIVGIGWSKINFSQYTNVNDLLQKVENEYYAYSNKERYVISRKLNEIRRFISIKPGDCIILPYYSYITIAEVTGSIIYDKKAEKLDIANQLPVNYLYKGKTFFTYPRGKLTTAFSRRLSIRGNTVSDLSEFADEIEKIKQEKEIWDNESLSIQKFKKELLKRIQEGKKTVLAPHGRGLEELVQKIFTWFGFEAHILPKNNKKEYTTQSADADIIATRGDVFFEQRILIQVKHHSEETSEWAVKQLIGALNGPTYQGYEGYVITTADKIKEDAKNLADANGIKIITGMQLMEILFEKLNSMDLETKRSLGISSVPQFIK